MERGLYIAAAGMTTEMARQDQIANELANAATPGYKADRISQQSFADLLLHNTQNGQVIGELGMGPELTTRVTDMTPQALKETGAALDMAVQGEGFFAVNTPQGVRYTRDGSFTANAQGILTDQMGNQVVGSDGRPVQLKADGTVDAAKVGLFNVPGATKQGDALFTGTAQGRPTGTVITGSLETSGVQPARTMVDMMGSLRAMEATQRAITTIDSTLDKSVNQVGTVGG